MLAAITEPLMAALLKPLLDRGFTRGEMPLWFVPAAVLLLFAVRGIAQFISQYALSRIANELATQGINLVMIFSVYPSISLFIEEKDLVRAHEALVRISVRKE